MSLDGQPALGRATRHSLIGRRLVPLLVDRGHEVTTMTRTPAKVAAARALGAEPVVADGLSPDAVMGAVSAARPDVVVHQMTALSEMGTNLRRFDRGPHFAIAGSTCGSPGTSSSLFLEHVMAPDVVDLAGFVQHGHRLGSRA